VLKKILIGSGSIVILSAITILVLAAGKPDELRVQRTMTINAPAEKIYPHINDLRQWSAWSPWEKRDPKMKKSYSGAESGKGAVYSWDGNAEVGTGQIEIAQCEPTSKVVMNLHFQKPFEANNIAEFTLQPKDNVTAVTWAMHGPNQPLCKVMQVFMNMDEMCGKDFEEGLSSLKSIVEQ
jgi:hypothetical protein